MKKGPLCTSQRCSFHRKSRPLDTTPKSNRDQQVFLLRSKTAASLQNLKEGWVTHATSVSGHLHKLSSLSSHHLPIPYISLLIHKSSLYTALCGEGREVCLPKQKTLSRSVTCGLLSLCVSKLRRTDSMLFCRPNSV